MTRRKNWWTPHVLLPADGVRIGSPKQTRLIDSRMAKVWRGPGGPPRDPGRLEWQIHGSRMGTSPECGKPNAINLPFGDGWYHNKNCDFWDGLSLWHWVYHLECTVYEFKFESTGNHCFYPKMLRGRVPVNFPIFQLWDTWKICELTTQFWGVHQHEELTKMGALRMDMNASSND